MNTLARFTAASIVGVMGVLAPALRAQTAPTNPNFEAGPRDSAPSGWIARAPAGYRIVVVDSGAFQGRQAVLLDGTAASGGFSSANENYSLPDSAMILLTVANDADRTGVVYGGPIAPDERHGRVPDGGLPTRQTVEAAQPRSSAC